MSITVARLHNILGALIEQGHGRKSALINKASFTHPCEQDGVCMLDVVSVEGPKWIPMADDDGGTKWNKDGTESGKNVVSLEGGWDEERRLLLAGDPIARAISVMDDVLSDIEDWEDKALDEAVRAAQDGLRLAYCAPDDDEPAAEVVKMDTGGSWIERSRALPIGTKLYARGGVVSLPRRMTEAVARAIYEQWAANPGYVPWVEDGNSLKQREARDIARAALTSATEGKKL